MVPPPYSPFGITPSKVRYSSGWSSVCTARRFSPGTRLGPRVTAQLFSTPSSSSLRSKCRRRAACFWTQKRSPAGLALGPRLRGCREISLLGIGVEGFAGPRCRLTASGRRRSTDLIDGLSLGLTVPRRSFRPIRHRPACLSGLACAAPPLLGRRLLGAFPLCANFEGAFFGATVVASASTLRLRASIRFTTFEGRGASEVFAGWPACFDRTSSTTASS